MFISGDLLSITVRLFTVAPANTVYKYSVITLALT